MESKWLYFVAVIKKSLRGDKYSTHREFAMLHTFITHYSSETREELRMFVPTYGVILNPMGRFEPFFASI